MKKLANLVVVLGMMFLVACGNGNDSNTGSQTSGAQAVEPRAVFALERVYVDGELDTALTQQYTPGSVTFFGEEQGGNVVITIDGYMISAGINPSRSHPSFESGEWHHHLYASNTQQGSPRISFYNAWSPLGIDHNPEATDNTQSAYQHGNLHYIVDTGEYRLRFTIGGELHELFFVLQG